MFVNTIPEYPRSGASNNCCGVRNKSSHFYATLSFMRKQSSDTIRIQIQYK